MSLPNNNYLNMKTNTSKQHSSDVIIHIGCSTDSKPNWNSNLVKNNATTAQTYIGTTTETTNKFVVVPYSKGLSESFRNVCSIAGVQVHFKGANTVKELLIAPRDKDNIIQKGEVIYRYRLDQPSCNMEYIGETGISFGERCKEHLRALSSIFNHFQTAGHNITLDNFSIVCRESQGFTRTIKEAMFIRVNDPPLNRNLGKYQLPHIWDEVLQDLPALYLQ